MRIILLICIIGMTMGASSCQREKEDLFRKIDADVWLHEQIPAEVCARVPELNDIGIYRKVKCTDAARKAGLCAPGAKTYEEFIPYCNVAVKKQISMHENQFKKWIDLAREKIDQCQ